MQTWGQLEWRINKVSGKRIRQHVQKQIPPTPDGSESTSEVIKQLFPEAKQRETKALFGYEEKKEGAPNDPP